MVLNALAKPSMLHMRCRLFSLLLAWLLVGCVQSDDKYQLEVLRVGVLPDQHPEQLVERYSALIAYLANELGVSHELVIPDSYEELVELFAKKQINLAYFGGVTFIYAHKKAAAVPLVMRDTDLKFTSYFLVNAQHPAKSIKELRGRRFSFGPIHSTSGHLMPRYSLMQQNITPETFFSEVRYSGGHDQTVQWIRDGTVDAGAANAVVVRQMVQSGRLRNGALRILGETLYYANYVWAVQPSLGNTETNRLRDAFLALSSSNPLHAKILSRIGANFYLPASLDDFKALETIMDKTTLVENAANKSAGK
jgi:phosphonate transport system substrate-binding protein